MLTALRIVLIILGIILTVVVVMQAEKMEGSGSMFGGGSSGSDNYFGKNKGQGKEARLNFVTKASAVALVILSIVMVILQRTNG